MITIESKNIEYAQAMLGDMPKQIRAAANSAINRTLTMVRSKSSKSIRANYLVNKNKLKGRITKQRSKVRFLRGSVSIYGRPFLLTNFKVSLPRLRTNRKTNKKYRKGPVRVQVLKQGTLKPVRGLFIGTTRAGSVLPMRRVGKSRYPLEALYGPSLPQMFGSKRVLTELVPLAEETLNKRFLREVNYRFGKIHGGK